MTGIIIGCRLSYADYRMCSLIELNTIFIKLLWNFYVSNPILNIISISDKSAFVNRKLRIGTATAFTFSEK